MKSHAPTPTNWIVRFVFSSFIIVLKGERRGRRRQSHSISFCQMRHNHTDTSRRASSFGRDAKWRTRQRRTTTKTRSPLLLGRLECRAREPLLLIGHHEQSSSSLFVIVSSSRDAHASKSAVESSARCHLAAAVWLEFDNLIWAARSVC